MIVQQTHPPLLSTQASSLPPPCKHDAAPTDLVTVYCALSHQQRQERFFGTADIADKYGIARRTIQDWISSGLIAAVKIGKKYRVEALSVEAYLQQCTERHEVSKHSCLPE